MKKTETIVGADMNLEIGKPAFVFKRDGQLYRTSPVERYHIAGGMVYIETKNTIYTSNKN